MLPENGNGASGEGAAPERSHISSNNVSVARPPAQHNVDRPCFRLILEPMPHCASPLRALRQVPKFAQRSCGLCCTSIEEVGP